MNKVFIGSRTLTLNGHPSLKRLEDAGLKVLLGPPGKRPSEEEQLKILPECVAYLAGTERISEKVLESSKELKIISRNGVGIENIDLDAAKRLNIQVSITPGSNAQGVAELAISLMLVAGRSILPSSYSLKKGEWKRIKGFELAGRTLGVIGTGNIGKRVIKMALGMNMIVIGYDLYPEKDFNPSNNFQYKSLNNLLANSDVISLHCPPGEKAIIDESAVKKMKKGVIIINTARAGVVDDSAILNGLKVGTIDKYATDVYDKEPPKIDDLLSHERVICTPHIGAYTEESIDRAVEEAIDNILRVLELDDEN
ncbi:MAG: oxidoreductase [Candidatus Lokiarchaeota archaeon]|nr:oxidoreductase [Candidatus Lokiarchaeota archaeon]MBD3340968.1 oxidoreductase [Candidatus Lokiarchaeota archaeon]